MVFINMEISFGVDGEIYHAMFANLFQHVVEKAQSWVNRAGKDPGNLYSGHTSLYGPRGELLSMCKEG